jgi:3-hydroxyacyl-CoA dehydrogenase
MNNALGIIGSGMLGGAVAHLAVNAGMDVVLSNSRGPETLRQLTADLGPRARAATPAEAAAAVGTMAESWRVQEGSPAWVLPYLSDPRLSWPQDPGGPAGVEKLRAALGQARRS